MIQGFLIFQTTAEIIMLVLGVIGNVLVVLVVAKRRKMRTVTNYLILNLACADLTVLSSNIPIDLTTRFMNRWVFGKATCKIIKPLQTMGTIASILTLVAISLSRYTNTHFIEKFLAAEVYIYNLGNGFIKNGCFPGVGSQVRKRSFLSVITVAEQKFSGDFSACM